MGKILVGKLKTRKRLAALPFDQKLTLMEMMRDRSLLIAANSSTTPLVVVSGDVVVISGVGVRIEGLMPLVVHQSPDQLNIRQNSVTLFAESRKQPERWHVNRLEPLEPEFALLSQA